MNRTELISKYSDYLILKNYSDATKKSYLFALNAFLNFCQLNKGANQKEGKPAPKGYKYIDPLIFMDQFLQHVLPPYFAKSRRYGLHASATKKKFKDVLPDSIKRNGHLIRTVFQILNQLLNERPFQCEK